MSESRVKAVNELFSSELSVVNLGLGSFAENLRACGANAVQVRWKPPAGGDARLIEALDRIARNPRVDVDAANRLAAERILKSKPRLVGVGVAGDAVPGMKPDLVLHAGPPVTWARMCGPLKGAVIGGLLTSLFLTLVVVPAAYDLFDDWQQVLKRKKRKERQEVTDAASSKGEAPPP
jgi:hypothetical protein